MHPHRWSIHYQMKIPALIATHFIVTAILALTVDRTHAEIFNWSPQCPEPTWFGVCEGEICDVENNTPLSVNNWGRSGCGSVAFPGVDDDVEINDGMVSLVDTAVGSLSIGANGVVDQPIGTLFGFTQLSNAGTFTLRENLNTSPLTTEYPNFFNAGHVRCIGDVAIGDLTHAGHIDVEQGSLTLTGELNVTGGTMNVAPMATASFFRDTLLSGNLSVDGSGEFLMQATNVGLTTNLRVQGASAVLDFQGSPLSWNRGNIIVDNESSLINRQGSAVRKLSNAGALQGRMINFGTFAMDDMNGILNWTGADITNFGSWVVDEGSFYVAKYTNRGHMVKNGPQSSNLAMLEGDLGGVININEGTVQLEGDLFFDDVDLNVADGAALTITAAELDGYLNGHSDGQMRIRTQIPSILPEFVTFGSNHFTVRVSGNGLLLGPNPNLFQLVSSITPTLENAFGGKLTIDTSNLLPADLNYVILNVGHLFFGSGLMRPRGISDARIVNEGLFELRNDSESPIFGTAVTVPIGNSGIIRKTGPGVGELAIIENQGVISVTEGSLRFTNSFVGVTGGRLQVDDFTELRFGVGHDNVISIQGDIRGTTAAQGQVLIENQDVLVPLAGATIGFDGAGMIWRGVALNTQLGQAMPLRHAANSLLHVEPSPDTSAAIQLNLALENYGTMVFGDRVIVSNTEEFPRMRNFGEMILIGPVTQFLFNLSLFGPFVLENEGRFCSESGSNFILGDIANRGEFVVSQGSLTLAGRPFLEAGVFHLGEGAILQVPFADASSPSTYLEITGGALSGEGTVVAPVTIADGVIKPGVEVGTLTIDSDLSILTGRSGGIAIDIGSAPEGAEFDQLIVNGSVSTLGPDGDDARTMLRVSAVNGFTPVPGMTYEVLTATGGGLDAPIPNVVLVDFPTGVTVEQTATGNALLLSIVVGNAPQMLGDMNCDGLVDNNDIIGFAMALTDRDAYAFENPICDANRADMNGDGALNGSDIPAFIQTLAP